VHQWHLQIPFCLELNSKINEAWGFEFIIEDEEQRRRNGDDRRSMPDDGEIENQFFFFVDFFCAIILGFLFLLELFYFLGLYFEPT
jgi:hypothetical protein